MTKLTAFFCIATLLVSFSLVSCTSKIEESKTYQRNGLLYQIGSEEPYTGIVTGESSHEGYRRKPFRFKKAYEDGRLNGRSFYYYLDGKVESVEPYENGIINGVVTRYYQNGQLKARLHFVDGMRGGIKGEMFWNEDGSRKN